MLTGIDYDLNALLNALLEILDLRFNQLKEGNPEQLDADYIDNLYRFMEPGSFLYQGKQVSAKMTGVNHFGQLILELPEGGMLECGLSDLKFL